MTTTLLPFLVFDLTLFTQIGRVLPLIARSVLKAVLPDIPHDEVDYNIVQNNGKTTIQHV